MTPFAYRRGALALLASATFVAACQSTPEPTPKKGLVIEGYTSDPRLDHAASLLCARDSDGVIDGDIRRASGVYDGQVVGLYRTDDDQASLRQDAAGLFKELRATHAGTARGQTMAGKGCIAAVGARRHLDLKSVLPAGQNAPEAFPLALDLGDESDATLYVARPNGVVERHALEVDKDGRAQTIVAVGPDEGRYIIEVLTGDVAVDPEVALYWSFIAGTPALPPAPVVLFPDAGHSDLALSRRAEALVQRLRNDLEIESLKVKPELIDVAAARAGALLQAGTLGHRVPFSEGPVESVKRMAPNFFHSVLVEVQAQASTLDEAWRALLRSPAHRYELSRRDISHFGAAVTQGKDGAGQPVLTVVVLLAKKITFIPDAEARAGIFGKVNIARHNHATPPLVEDANLSDIGTNLAASLVTSRARAGVTADITAEDVDRLVTMAHDADPAATDVTVQVYVLDDPLRIGASGALVDPRFVRAGFGFARTPDGRAVVVALLSDRNASP